MRILGIDPGSRKAGWGIIEIEGRKISYIASGTMSYDTKVDFIDRLAEISQSVTSLLNEYSPDEVAFESLVYVKSVEALSKLAQARGAMIGAAGDKYFGKLFEYSPNLVKQTVAGHGLSKKEGVAKMVSMLLGVKEFKSADESDALAIAICHSLLRKTQVKKVAEERV